MSHCGLSGNLPSDLMQMWSLENLDLSFNSFSGKINFSQWSFGDNESRLEHLDLSHNLLEASHIDEWPKMLYLKEINLSYNHFNGELPEKIFEILPTLQMLQLNNNRFEGCFNLLRSWGTVEVLDVSSNRLVDSVQRLLMVFPGL